MTTEAPIRGGGIASKTGILISSDSHVIEPHDLWTKALGRRFGDRAPAFEPLKKGEGFHFHAGGQDPRARVQEMAQDGVSAEVLYPTVVLGMFGENDAELQEACFQVYNDWLMEYCSVATERLVGIAAISAYNIDHAVQELERCRAGGLRGGLIWEAPHPSLPFTSDHYERLWAAAADLQMPITMHILTGHGYMKQPRIGLEVHRGSITLKTLEASNAVFDFVFYGALDRHPGLKLVMVEHEIGWLPFLVQQMDYYAQRHARRHGWSLSKLPGEFVKEQVYATFFNDPIGTFTLQRWGSDNCMWSSDFPHENSTWPHSLDVIARDLGDLPEATLHKLVRENVTRLYNLRVPEPIA